jgi:hypothetical protein
MFALPSKRVRLLSFAALLVACSGGDNASPDADLVVAEIDAGISPEIDAAPDPDAMQSLPASLVGKWDRIEDGMVTGYFLFEADGSATFDEPGSEHNVGTYSVDGTQLLLDLTNQDGERAKIGVGYFVEGDSLVVSALLPDGAVMGEVVGHWTGQTSFQGFDQDGNPLPQAQTLVDAAINADSSLVYQETQPPNSPERGLQWNLGGAQPRRDRDASAPQPKWHAAYARGLYPTEGHRHSPAPRSRLALVGRGAFGR